MDISKDALGSKPESVTNSGKKLLSRIFIGLLIFIIPTVIPAFLKIFVNYEDVENNFIDCQACLDNKNDCSSAIEIAQYLEEQEAEIIEDSQTITSQYTAPPISGEGGGGRNSEETINPEDYGNAEIIGGGKYFDRNDVTRISGLTAEQLVTKLNNCKRYSGKGKRYVPYAEDFIAAEKKWGINVFYMLGVYSLESGWAGSPLARQCNNLGGIKYGSKQRYYDNKPTTKCWQQKTGAWFAGFSTVGGFADYHAKLVKTRYVTPGAPYYHGKTPEAISKVYGHQSSVGTVIEIATNLSNC